MNSSVIIDGIEYISTNRASEMTRYSKDYIGQLSRAGKITSKKIGRIWYVNKDSLLDYKNSIEQSIIYQADSVSKKPSQVYKKSRSSRFGLIGIASMVLVLISVSVYSIFGSFWSIEHIGGIETKAIDASALNGLVVVESASTAEKNGQTADAIKNSFSDKVNVKVDPETNTGIITPDFGEATSSDYFYVMVPVDQ